MANKFPFIAIFFLAYLNNCCASRILFILPLASKSETNLFFPIAKELSLKGHEITYVAPYVHADTQLLSNFKSIIPMDPLQDTDIFQSPTILEERRSHKSFKYLMSFDPKFIYTACHKVYQNKDFQRIFSESFDLIFMSAFFNNCFDGLIHKFQVPFILMGSLPIAHWVVDLTGYRPPTSFVPVPLLGYSDKMSFSERFINTVVVWFFGVMDKTVFQSEYANIYREYLGQDYPEAWDIERNVSIIISNSNFVLNFPRPALQGSMVEVGGLQCHPPNKLSQELENFISGAKHGAILLSFGSLINATRLPEETRKIFFNVFSKLKQRVLWKWDGETMEDLPENVKLSKWVPQQDVLGHPNVRLFISHGGLLSTQESVYHGTPVLGIPFFFDQNINMVQAEKLGFALTLEILDLTEEKLEATIKEMLSNQKYTEKVKELSTVFKDQPLLPLDTAVYWVEYVLRHKGAPQLKSPARDLNFFEYHSYDVIAALSAILFGITSLLYWVTKKIYTIISPSKIERNFVKKEQ